MPLLPDELDALKAAAPACPAPAPGVLALARAQLQDAVDAQGHRYAHLRRAPGRRRRLKRLLVVMGATIAVLGVLAVVPVLDVPEGPRATAEAQQYLSVAAALESGRTPDRRADARFWYVRTRVSGEAFPGENGVREVWQARGVPGRLLFTPDAGGTPTETRLLPAQFSLLTWDELLALPTETQQLREAVFRLASSSGSGDTDSLAFTIIGELLREAPAPAALRAGLLRVAATVPGVALGEAFRDSTGRLVVPVSRDSSDGLFRDRLLFDVDEQRFVGEDHVVVQTFTNPGPDDPLDPSRSLPDEMYTAGTLWHRTLVLHAAAVDSLSERSR